MSNRKFLSGVDLTKTAFSMRFQQLQEALNDSLQRRETALEAVLAAQDRLILRMEGWVDSLADLHMSATSDIDLFRHTLDTNRKVYRLRTLAMHNVAVSDVEKDDLERALHRTIRKIPTNRNGAHSPVAMTGPH
jgi:enamine deaminase RidA (YjgF/YER057c/UK114 family)